MTRYARCVCELIVVVNVTIRTLPWRHRVGARQRESRIRMVKLSRRPGAGRMADLAGLREPTRHVIGVRRLIEIGKMARDACRSRQLVIVIYVAIGALPRWNCVLAGQRKCRLRMIELRRNPRAGRMASIAGLRKTAQYVIRVRRFIEVGKVTADAGDCREVVIVIGVAIGALPRRNRVRAGQRRIMRKLCIHPGIGCVAGLTRLIERARIGVLWVVGRGKVFLMAAYAIRRHRRVLAKRAVLVAVVTRERRVRTCQREAIHMLLDLRD